jgi:hypothetical protein
MKQTMYHFRNPPTGYTPLNVLLAGGSHLAYVLRRSPSCKMTDCTKPYGARPLNILGYVIRNLTGARPYLARWLLSQVASWHTSTVRFSPTNPHGGFCPPFVWVQKVRLCLTLEAR